MRRAGWAVAMAMGVFVHWAGWAWPRALASAAPNEGRMLTVRSGKPGFTSVSGRDSRITFTNRVTAQQIAANRLLEDGSGVALGDIDGDGWCDVYFGSLQGQNRLYRNLGNWTFEDITVSAGVGCPGQASTGVVLADVDGDRDLDLLVNSLGGGTRLFRNEGSSRFSEMADSGLARRYGSHSLALGDVDGDGDLDLYVANYRATTAKDSPVKVKVRQVAGLWEVPSEHREQFRVDVSGGSVALLEVGDPDQLYLNDGQGRFSAVPWTTGQFLDDQGKPLTTPPRDWGLSVMIRDLNQDGLPDIYVCNDYFTPDRIWINQGRAVFRLLSPLALRQTSWAAMAVDVADINRDGWDDIFVSEMLSRDHVRRHTQTSLREVAPLPAYGWGWFPGDVERTTQVMRNMLALNRGDGTYAEIGQLSGVHASEWTWGCLFLDVDLDGYEDLLIANGHSRDLANSDSLAAMDRLPPATDAAARLKSLHLFGPLPLPHLAFRNQRDLTFADVSQDWGFNRVGVANGMAEGDLDNDGDLDVVLNNLNEEAVLLRNEGGGERVAVRLVGSGGNTRGIGARVTLKGGKVEQAQELISGGRYLSGGEALRVFAGGGGTNLSLEVKWRSGKVSVVRGVQGNRLYEVSEAGAEAVPPVKPPEVKPLLVEVSERLGLTHVDEAYDDFGRQPLLPRRLSGEGPGLSWGDLNGDGVEDLLVGSGRGGRLRVLGGNGRGGFGEVKAAAWSGVVTEDQTGIVNWSVEAGASTVLVGQSNYETGRAGAAVKSYGIFLGDVQAGPELPGWEASVGPVVVADLDGDGDLDVFVGGRVEAGKYPKSASSKIWRQEGGQWVPDERSNQQLRGVGLVSGAVWTDLNGDGFPELVLAREWDSLKIFGNRSGQLSDDSEAWGVSQAKGLWTGVTAGDLNGDGRLELVVGNWGRNTAFEGRVEPSVWHGDVDGNGTWDVVESYRDGGREVPRRDWRTVGQAVPEVAGRFTSYRSYGEASLEQIYGEGLKRLERRTVNTLDSVVWWNRGTRLEAQALPVEAQMSPVFGVNVGDVDGDGREDVWLSQNFFGVDRETGRMDAGRGVWFKGGGGENLRALSGAESGVKIYGDGRGSALADFDGDGRVDLVVAQNGGPVRLYRNEGAKVGLRVRLVGLPGNANGIGAVVRLGTKDQLGPAREIHGGSGWWSQDSAVSVLAWPTGSSPAELQVRWPGGQTTTHPVPAQTREVRVHVSGALEVVP